MQLPWLSPVQDNSQGSSSPETGNAAHVLAQIHQLHRTLFMQEDKQCTFSPETGTAAHVLAASEQPHAIDSMITLPIAHEKPVPAYVGPQ